MLDFSTFYGKKKKPMQDIQSMLPYIDIAFHCKLLSLKQSAMQYVATHPVPSRLLALARVGLGQEQ